MKKVNQNTIINEIVGVGGVSKANAVNIFNVISNAWTQDKIALLSALEKGIAVETGRKVKRRPAKKVTKKVTKKAAPKTTTPKTTKKAAPKKTTPLATVGKKLKGKKGKKKLKKSKLTLPKTTTKTKLKTA